MSIFSTAIAGLPKEPVEEQAVQVEQIEQAEQVAEEIDAAVSDVVVEEAAQEALEADVPVVQVGKVRSNLAAKTLQILPTIEQTHRLTRDVYSLSGALANFQMITNFKKVATEHNLSAPLAAAFHATPGFGVAVESFPDVDIFNTIPEHQSSDNNTAGLESFNQAQAQTCGTLSEKANRVVATFKDVLAGLDTTVTHLQAQVAEDKEALEDSDVTDEVMASIPVNTLSHESFTEILTKLEEGLSSIDTFNVDDLQANPEKIKDEVQGLMDLTADLGKIIGMQFDEYGLSDADRDENYQPSPGTFDDKAITKTALIFYLDKASVVLDAMKAIADKKDELSAAVDAAITDMPTAAESDDVVYGQVEHVTLLSCYASLVSKLIREGVVLVSMLLTTVNAVLDIDDGAEVAEAEPTADPVV